LYAFSGGSHMVHSDYGAPYGDGHDKLSGAQPSEADSEWLRHRFASLRDAQIG
jgi:hypothetical protein